MLTIIKAVMAGQSSSGNQKLAQGGALRQLRVLMVNEFGAHRAPLQRGKARFHTDYGESRVYNSGWQKCKEGMRNMRLRRIQTLVLSVVFSGLFPVLLWSQLPLPVAGSHGPWRFFNTIKNNIWHIFGTVTDFKGEPIRGAKVHIDLGYGMKYLRDLKTDAQGQFRTQYELNSDTIKTLVVNLSVTRKGYH